MRISLLVTLLAILAGCATPAPTTPAEPSPAGRSVQAGKYPGGTPAARPIAPAPVRSVAPMASRPAPTPSASTPAPAPMASRPAPAPAVRPAPVRAPAPPSGSLVKLRGSQEVHVTSCSRVVRAHPAGVVAAQVQDGPPCFTCRRAEAVAKSQNRAAQPVAALPPRAAPARSAPAASRAPATAVSYVRLLGSKEVHISTCSRVTRAHPAGVKPARPSDGPACYYCRKAEATTRGQ